MKSTLTHFLLLLLLATQISCKKQAAASDENIDLGKNVIRRARGLSMARFNGYTIVTVSNPWPGATKRFTYVLKNAGAKIPDSLKSAETITVPVKSIVVTSTTHIPSLEMLGEENTLVGFPELSYISSEKVRARIDSGNIRELGQNQSLNIESIIDLQPDVIIGYGIDNSNPMLDNLRRNGLKIIVNGDWNEQTPLGKAEWIRLYGVLYGKEKIADSIFSTIEKDYNSTLALAAKTTNRPSVMAGAVFESKWYLPQGESWGSMIIKDAGGKYLWADSPGTGSLSLPFEIVLEKAQNADFWIGPGQFTSFAEMRAANPHYAKFKAFRTGNVYSFSSKKGKTGGVIYYELAPNRPDLVLKDVLKILHPETLPGYQLYFFEKLK